MDIKQTQARTIGELSNFFAANFTFFSKFFDRFGGNLRIYIVINSQICQRGEDSCGVVFWICFVIS